MEWKHASSPKTKKFKAIRCLMEAYGDNFWDSKGVVYIDYLPHRTTMNGDYYSNLLKQVRQSIKDKRCRKIRRGILFHQDNAPVHTSWVAMEVVRECGYKLFPHPLYSTHPAPSDLHLFPRLKKHLCGRWFEEDEELTAAVEGWLGDQDVEVYWWGINDWQTRWTSVWSWKVTMLKNNAIQLWLSWSFCVRLKTFWYPLVYMCPVCSGTAFVCLKSLICI